MKTFKFIKVISAIVVSTSMCAGTALPVFALPQTNIYTESPNGSTYTLTYDDNTDEDITVPKDQTCKDGDSIKISKDKLKRDGYTFVGWSTEKDYVYDEIESEDDKEFFEPGDKIELTEDTTLYAVWEIKEDNSNLSKEEPVFGEDQTEEEPYYADDPVTYQLMFDSHGGTLSFDHVDTDENGNATIPAEEPTKDGNTFQGWSDDPESGEVDYLPGDTLTLSNDMKLYAVWQKDVVIYQLMFDAHGGNLSFDHVDTDENGNATIPAEEPTKDGNTFQGWSDDPESGEVDYLPGNTLTLSSDMKLYAVWQKDVVIYQLMFDAHGGNLSFDHVDTDENGNATIPAEEPTKDGNTFQGWADDPESGVVMYLPGDTLTLSNDMKLYAVWEVNPVTVQIRFDAAGGSGAPEAINAEKGSQVIIPDQAPTKDGFNFLGWASDPESGQVKYTSGQEITADDMRLYAVWEEVAQDIQIRFDAAGGSGGPSTINAKKGDKVTIPAETPTKDGFNFLGWATDPESGQVKYTPGQEITADDMRLYAVWEEVVQDVQIRFDATGGSGGPEAINAKKGDKVTIPAETPTKDGFKFLGWDSDPQAKTVKYTPSQEITADDMRLYAVWEQVTQDIQIRFDVTGGSGGPEAINAKKGDKVTIPAETPTKDGYKFLGWDSDPQAKTVKYTPGQEITADDMRLYAVWEQVAQDVQIRFDAHGGTGGPEAINAKKGDKVTIPAETPTKDGYKFLGWATDPESGKVTYTPGQEITAEDMRLYAVWEKLPQKYKLMFDANGGSEAPNTVESNEKGAVKIPANTPKRDGYTFVGWGKTPASSTADYKPNQEITITSDTKLYAVWTENGKKVVAKLTFNANGGTGAPNAINAASDGSVTIPTTGPYRNGYKFLGWSKDAKAKEASYKPGDKLNIYADTTLYAVWQSNNGANTGVNNNSTLYLIGGGIALAAAIGLLLMKKKNSGE